MAKKYRSILVTAALPYANGPLHLGHMVEFIQTDIWVRFQRLQRQRCYFVCGDDAHGTPIMLRADSLSISPEKLIAQYHQEHYRDLKDFGVNFDNFYTTHSEENRTLANEIYARLKKRGDITTRIIRQAYDPIKNMFLPDRYVKGECPKCGAKDQYGDSCEQCGATYSPTELKNPISVVSQATPIEKESEHYFFCLDHYESFLKQWIQSGHLQSEVGKKLQEWFEAGLKQWDITRDSPYFGFEINDSPGKYFYVWLDAPIGYMASFKNFCDRLSRETGSSSGPIGNGSGSVSGNGNVSLTENKLSAFDALPTFDEFWAENSQTELYHFIGKDIVYFHALFWPAMLKGSQFRTPTGINVHGFLTINGQKMSKSRGTFINARQYLDLLPPEYLRYYFACKLSSGIEDIDFQADDFVNRVNADLVGKLVNIASRSAGFIHKLFNNRLTKNLQDPLYDRFVEIGGSIADYYEKREYRFAMKEIMLLCDEANRYIDEKKPWILAKDSSKHDLTHHVCSLSLNLFRVLMIYLKPVLPQLAIKVEDFLNCNLDWEERKIPLTDHEIKIFQPLLHRLELKEVLNMLESNANTNVPSGNMNASANAGGAGAASTSASKNSSIASTSASTNAGISSTSASKNSSIASTIKSTNAGAGTAGSDPTSKSAGVTLNPIKETISIDDFAKIDLRVAAILNAEIVPEADKLLKLTLDLGHEQRQVFAGIKEAYPNPEVLIGKKIVMVANLAPRKMRFGLSEGMILTSSASGNKLWILEPNSEADVGSQIR